ncbi:ankyrin repeat-containing domain protein [Echria macrotheca]|uniref:Ankyrin repeat-containing domain protein n=1 Tax=Echria macrotheca TaxID=438768 RepID=A0AAJ0BCP9_9PEZI|nr:ankyrin repeat-containing domain protein [Echria macrotheca]
MHNSAEYQYCFRLYLAGISNPPTYLWAVTNAWRDAPADLHRLRDDLARTQRFFAETQEGINSMYALESRSKIQLGESHASWRELERLLDEGYAVLRQIEKFVDHLLDDRPPPPPPPPTAGGGGGLLNDGTQTTRELGKRRRIIWMTSSRKIQKLRDELRGIVSNVCRLLIAQNVSASAEIFVSLERGITSGAHSAAEQIASHTEKTLQKYQDAAISRFGKILELSQETILAQVERRLDELGNKIMTPPIPPETNKATNNNVQWSVQQISITGLPQDHHSFHNKLKQPPPAIWSPDLANPMSSQVNLHKCDMSCRCACHASAAFRWCMVSLSPVLLGRMAIGYRGHSTRRCSIRSCSYYHIKRRPSRSIQIQYTFPDWLARIAVSMFCSTNLNGSPQMVIRVLNRLHFKSVQAHGLFGRVRAGDIEGVKQMLRDGTGSVYDVVDPAGMSLLNEALHELNYEMAEFLLRAGADPHQQHLIGTGKGTSAMDHAVNLFINRRRLGGSEGVVALVTSLFPVATYIRDLEYPAISMIIMGILHMDLGEALRKPEYLAGINETGEGHLTPLAVAVTSGDLKAARLLLRAGADVNARFGTMQYTALHRACLYDDARMVKLLLEAGADIHARDRSGHTPLAFAAGSKYDIPDILDVLLRHGADVTTVDPFGSQPLSRTAIDILPVKARFLMDRGGADVNHRDHEGETALNEAVLQSLGEMCRVFLAWPGHDVLNVNKYGMTILHNVARDADAATMRVFTEAKIQGLNPAARDAQGRTAVMVFSERKQTVELCAAFEKLLDSVERGYYTAGFGEADGECCDSDDEEFFDAKEMWENREKG